MKVYVDELPENCFDCYLCQQNDIGCYLCYGFEEEYDYVADKNIKKERLETCPLQSLTDYTKQVRKKVCEEIRKFAYDTFKEFGCFDETDLEHILDQIQGETKC